jgi:hypothetical protein
MSRSKLLGLVVALGAVFVSMLAFGVSMAWAATPPGAYLWPGSAPGGTASDVVAIVLVASTIIAAAVYGYFALKRERGVPAVKEIPVIGATPDGRAPEHERKAA